MKFLATILLLTILSCTSTKEVDLSTYYTKEQLDSASKETERVVTKKLNEKISSQEGQITFFKNSDQSLRKIVQDLSEKYNLSSEQVKDLEAALAEAMLQPCEPTTKIVYRPDGSKEILTSNIATLNEKLFQSDKSLDSFAIEHEKLIVKNESLEKQITELETKKKVKVFNLWWLFFVGFVVGLIITKKFL